MFARLGAVAQQQLGKMLCMVQQCNLARDLVIARAGEHIFGLCTTAVVHSSCNTAAAATQHACRLVFAADDHDWLFGKVT